jgi:hypothetical protein
MSNDETVSRRKSLQLTLAVTAFGLALGKQAVDSASLAKQIMVDGKPENLSAAEYSIYIKLSNTEQSYFIKLSNSERKAFIKLDNIKERSFYLKLHAND